MKLIVTLIMCSSFLAVLPPTVASRGNIDLPIHGEVLSARLRKIPLKIILEKLERERGIWFRGDPSLLEEELENFKVIKNLPHSIFSLCSSHTPSL